MCLDQIVLRYPGEKRFSFTQNKAIKNTAINSLH